MKMTTSMQDLIIQEQNEILWCNDVYVWCMWWRIAGVLCQVCVRARIFFFWGGGMYGSIYVLSWVQNVFLEGHLCKLCVWFFDHACCMSQILFGLESRVELLCLMRNTSLFRFTILIIVCRYYVSLNVPQTKKNEYCCVPSHTPHLYAWRPSVQRYTVMCVRAWLSFHCVLQLRR